MLKSSGAYIRQTIVADGSPMARIVSTALGRAGRAVEAIFRRSTAPVPRPNIAVVAKPPVGIVTNVLSGIYRGGFISKFIARSSPLNPVAAARSRYGFRLVNGSCGAGQQGGNAFKGLSQKLSMLGFVAVGVAVGVDENQMRRLAGFDTVYSDIQALFELSKESTTKVKMDVSIESLEPCSDFEVNYPVYNEFSQSRNWNEEQDVSSFVLVRPYSSASLDSNVSDDSDITILSDEGCENDNEQIDEDLVVCDADNLIGSGVFVELGASAMSDDFEHSSLIDELKLALSVVQAQGVQLCTLRDSLIQRNAQINEARRCMSDTLHQSDSSVSNTTDSDVGENETTGRGDDDLLQALATVTRQKRELNTLRRMVTNRNKKIKSLQRRTVTLESMEANGTRRLKSLERRACEEQLPAIVYCKRDACCGPGVISC